MVMWLYPVTLKTKGIVHKYFTLVKKFVCFSNIEAPCMYSRIHQISKYSLDDERNLFLLEKGVTKLERGKSRMYPVVMNWIKGWWQYELVTYIPKDEQKQK